MSLIIIAVIVIGVIMIARRTGAAARANQMMLDAMTPEQQDRIYIARHKRSQQKFLFAVFLGGVLFVFYLLGSFNYKNAATSATASKPDSLKVGAINTTTPAFPAPSDGPLAWKVEQTPRVEQTPSLDTKDQILAELAKTPSSDVDKQGSLYLRLSQLDPSNATYAKKLVDLEAKKLEEQDKFSHPENLVLIENFSWSKEGFGNVMAANFVIKNKLPWPVKDIEIRCEHSAPSGTMIDSNTRTIYQRLEANQTRRIRKFNMGFIHSQATRSNCEVVNVAVIR
jgi:hypothetical protein